MFNITLDVGSNDKIMQTHRCVMVTGK